MSDILATMGITIELSTLPEMVAYAKIRDSYYRKPAFLRWLFWGEKRRLDAALLQAQRCVLNETMEWAKEQIEVEEWLSP